LRELALVFALLGPEWANCRLSPATLAVPNSALPLDCLRWHSRLVAVV